MYQNSKSTHNIVLLRGAALWLIVALVLAWCLVAVKLELGFFPLLFKDFHRLLQAHLDFLLMSSLIFGLYATKVSLPWHICWAIVVGAFTNSSLFLLQAIFPEFNPPGNDTFSMLFRIYMLLSISVTTYGFGRAALRIFWTSF